MAEQGRLSAQSLASVLSPGVPALWVCVFPLGDLHLVLCMAHHLYSTFVEYFNVPDILLLTAFEGLAKPFSEATMPGSPFLLSVMESSPGFKSELCPPPL